MKELDSLKGMYKLNINQAMRDTQLVDLMNIEWKFTQIQR